MASIIATLIALVLRGSAVTSQPGHFLNPKGFFELSKKRARDDYMANARKMMLDWFAQNPEKPVTILTDTGYTTVLPPSMANEIRNDDRLNFAKVAMMVSFPVLFPGPLSSSLLRRLFVAFVLDSNVVCQAFHSHLRGFEPFKSIEDDAVVKEVVRKNLTKQLCMLQLSRPLFSSTH